LTLAELALALSTTPHNLSEVINTRTGQNFYDFVNGYRVDEVKERLRDPNADHLTLLAIGLEAGFNSKSSFNAVFKKHTSMTPSEYKKTLRQT
jgi:AraC-like DNA-binding protein